MIKKLLARLRGDTIERATIERVLYRLTIGRGCAFIRGDGREA